jgi:hypothetical protein
MGGLDMNYLAIRQNQSSYDPMSRLIVSND